ncbi:MAG TPA: hypothetical protein PLV06_07495 [Bacteroidales bacterium]|nr:hypothetical protein [Bacteroidales bacterium]HPF02320.1 hypothetical protein [Bacteroidales bacterium]HPJ58958.1 hypothetical protein [Bacteroidales bacterium]HPR12212.1 hypothetical protein [Bacteroidales bacterium]HRW85854.1 hypothetical protein [Bacteroidales bacterium]
MKKISTLLFYLSLTSMILLSTGCEKMSNEELLLDHIWNYDEMTTNSTNETVLAIVALSNALFTGATFEFKSDGSYRITTTSNTDTGTWEFLDDDTFLMDTDQMQIISLTEDEFVVESEEVDTEYGNYYIRIRLVR